MKWHEGAVQRGTEVLAVAVISAPSCLRQAAVRDLPVIDVAYVISAETASEETQSVSGRFGEEIPTRMFLPFISLRRRAAKAYLAIIRQSPYGKSVADNRWGVRIGGDASAFSPSQKSFPQFPDHASSPALPFSFQEFLFFISFLNYRWQITTPQRWQITTFEVAKCHPLKVIHNFVRSFSTELSTIFQRIIKRLSRPKNRSSFTSHNRAKRSFRKGFFRMLFSFPCRFSR